MLLLISRFCSLSKIPLLLRYIYLYPTALNLLIWHCSSLSTYFSCSSRSTYFCPSLCIHFLLLSHVYLFPAAVLGLLISHCYTMTAKACTSTTLCLRISCICSLYSFSHCCEESGGSVVECLTRDRGAVGCSLTGDTACIVSLSKTSYPLLSTGST